MRILYWNILQGGGRRRLRIVDRILGHEPDLALIGEYRSTTGPALLGDLAAGGLVHQAHTDPIGIAYGQAATARAPIAAGAAVPDDELASRWLEVVAGGIVVLGVNIPSQAEGVRKERCWAHLLARAEAMRDRPFIVAGDFNSGAPHRDEQGGR